MIKFSSILSCYEAAEFSQAEAAELLGIGERTFRRWRQRFADEGARGRNKRRPSSRPRPRYRALYSGL